MVIVNGRAFAENEAVGLATEFGRNITEIKICSDCNETVTLVAQEFADLFVPAVAEAMVSLSIATSEDNSPMAVEAFEQAVSEVFVVDYSRVRSFFSSAPSLLSE